MWKTAALTLFAATLVAGAIHDSASAQGYRHGYGYAAGCPSLQRNGDLNPNLPPDWVFDPITQKWNPPSDANAVAQACQHQAQENAAQQYGYSYNQPRRDYRYGSNGYGYNGYGYNGYYGRR